MGPRRVYISKASSSLRGGSWIRWFRSQRQEITREEGGGKKGEERMSERGRGKQGEEEIRFFRKGSDTDTKWLRMGKKRESW